MEDGEEPELIPTVWCYLRQAQIDPDGDAPSGDYCLRFSSHELGNPSHASQGFGINGKKVVGLNIRMRIRGEGLYPDVRRKGLPGVYVLFIDDERATIRSSIVGGWRGTFDWRDVSVNIKVPESAREACIYFGLHGAKGTLWIDDIRMKAIY